MMFRRRRKLLRNEDGATAIEFAILAPLFFVFVLAIIDVCAYFFVAGQLQHGVVQAARQIRTGQLTGTGAVTRDQFRTLVCNNIQSLMITSCPTNVRVDVRAFNSFGTITLPASLDANADNVIDDTETTFNSGGASCPVIARAFYNYSTIVPALGALFVSIVPNNVYISAATAFRNEPFTGGTGAACTDF